MKKMLYLVVIGWLASQSMAATISLLGGEVSGCHWSNGYNLYDIAPSGLLTVKIVSDSPLLSLDAIVTLEGPGSIVTATDIAKGVQSFRWDAGFAADTIVTPLSVMFAAGNFNGIGGPDRVVAEFVVHVDDAPFPDPIKITIHSNDRLGGSYDLATGALADFDSTPIRILVPEPVSLSLLGVGALAVIRRRRV